MRKLDLVKSNQAQPRQAQYGQEEQSSSGRFYLQGMAVVAVADPAAAILFLWLISCGLLRTYICTSECSRGLNICLLW